MTRRREILLGLASAGIGVFLFLAVAEVVLRFLPVATGMRAVAVTQQQPILRFTPNRDFLFSRDWDMVMVNPGHVNNAGFVNAQDYRRVDSPPLLGVIGDSYIEATMVPYPLTMQGQLAKALEGRMRVYSFAASGAPLSQYLVWARHAVSDYGAKALVINVVGNDFDESHVAYKSGPGLWLYASAADGSLGLTLQEYHPRAIRKLADYSALLRYALFNLGVGTRLLPLTAAPTPAPRAATQGLVGVAQAGTAPTTGAADPPRFAGNTAADADPKRIALSLAAIDAFFRDLPGMAGLPPERILFTLDGFRHPDVAKAGAGTYFDLMRRAFLAQATALGYEAIDLDPLFFRQPAQAYNYPRDGHWNPAGHEVAAEAVLQSKMLAGLKP